jgi:hypothetical protein
VFVAKLRRKAVDAEWQLGGDGCDLHERLLLPLRTPKRLFRFRPDPAVKRMSGFAHRGLQADRQKATRSGRWTGLLV